jgi:hypothetical protein
LTNYKILFIIVYIVLIIYGVIMTIDVKTTNVPDRLNFHVTYKEIINPLDSDFESNGTVISEVDIQEVKKYGRIWGQILTFFGFASMVEGNYVNRKSFFKHLAEAWLDKHPNYGGENDTMLLKKLVRNIEIDRDLDKSVLSAQKVEKIFNDFKHISRTGCF